MATKHTTLITSDAPVNVSVDTEHQGVFMLFRALVRQGYWAQMSNRAQRVLVVLAEYVNVNSRKTTNEWLAWPSISTLERDAGLARGNITRALNDLEELNIIERRRQGGMKSTLYRLLPPPRWRKIERESGRKNQGEIEPVALAHLVAPAQPSRAVRKSVAQAQLDAPTSAGQARQRGSRGRAGAPQQSMNTGKNNSIDNPARDALRASGIGEPVLTQLVDSFDQAELLLRIKDWNTRKAVGQNRSVAWLISSIRNQYDLHTRTLAELEAHKRHAGRLQLDQANSAREASERAEQARIEAAVNEMFDAMDDDELDEWKDRAIQEYGSLTKASRNPDPRTNQSLKRLVLGLLARELHGSAS